MKDQLEQLTKKMESFKLSAETTDNAIFLTEQNLKYLRSCKKTFEDVVTNLDNAKISGSSERIKAVLEACDKIVAAMAKARETALSTQNRKTLKIDLPTSVAPTSLSKKGRPLKLVVEK